MTKEFKPIKVPGEVHRRIKSQAADQGYPSMAEFLEDVFIDEPEIEVQEPKKKKGVGGMINLGF